MPVDYCRHLVRKTPRSVTVFVAVKALKLHFVSKSVIVWTSS